jgi:hypothetical protein
MLKPPPEPPIDSCGCAMAARFVALGLIASIAWYGWHRVALHLTLGNLLLRVFLWSLAAGVAGKIIGLLVFKFAKPATRQKRTIAVHSGRNPESTYISRAAGPGLSGPG